MRNTLAIISIALCCSCGPHTSTNLETANFDSNKDYFTHKAVTQHAKNFSVSYHKNYKIVRTNARLSSWEGNGDEIKQDVMVLVQRGTPAPELTGDLENATIIPIPAERVAVNIENGETFMDELGLFDRVVAVGGAISYDDTVRQRVLDKDLAQIGYSWHQPANLEVVLERRTDLFLMNLSNLDFADAMDKSRQLGIPTASVFEWAESDYLARAEWIKYYALFFNAEEMANQKFDEIKGQVENIRKLTADLNKKPSMVWGYYAGKDRWVVHKNSIETQFMRDIGVENVLEDLSGPVQNNGDPMSSEEFLSKAHKATHWVIGDAHSAALPSQNFMNQFDSWKSGRLYHNMKRSKPEANAFDWYGRAVVRPDLVLADLVGLIYPELELNHELYFMDRFDKAMKLPLDVNNSLYN